MGKTAYISDNKSALLAASQIPLCRMLLGLNQGLINYIDNKAKCRHLKKLTCKGTLRQVFFRVYRLEIHVGINNPALWTIAPLTFSLVQLSPLPHFHVYSVQGGGLGVVWGHGSQTEKHLPQSPFTVFLDDDILHCLLWVLSFYGLNPRLLYRLHWQLMTSLWAMSNPQLNYNLTLRRLRQIIPCIITLACWSC